MRTLHRNALTVLILGNLALAPAYAIAQDAGPAPAQGEVTDLESVVVTGRRAADRLAIDDKRYADGQVDSIRSDDVGRLPDQNVAEATRRLPGVTSVNDQGEGRYLTVRGISPDLLNVTLNGQTAAAPEPDGRQVKLDDVPSSLIGAVTVSKTLTPDMDANAIAGQVVDLQAAQGRGGDDMAPSGSGRIVHQDRDVGFAAGGLLGLQARRQQWRLLRMGDAAGQHKADGQGQAGQASRFHFLLP